MAILTLRILVALVGVASSAAFKCEDATKDGTMAQCYRNVQWAKETGIVEHPEWYPTGATTDADFQCAIYLKGDVNGENKPGPSWNCTLPPCAKLSPNFSTADATSIVAAPDTCMSAKDRAELAGAETTKEPSEEPSEAPPKSGDVEAVEDDTVAAATEKPSGGSSSSSWPWWGILLLVVGLLLLALLAYMLCMKCGEKPKKDKKKTKKEKAPKSEKEALVEPVATTSTPMAISQPEVLVAPPVYTGYAGVPTTSVEVAPPVYSARQVAMPVATMTAAPAVQVAPPVYAATMAAPVASITAAPVPTYSGPSAFDMVDRNHDGVISRAEFNTIMGQR